ncbi:similar to Saccharomyces cerevisiae YPL024W RMI1 Subunit of the RecQ (Sgs1p) - Topo III (Top3p) complex [Maudiozyma barnettii]|uniref:Similar to Saccharomyces cerevisiae YPL024W RMI1 Subunit of the RecQ (Sgs1p) - Topo III (Top3p) complex n=1 Tax=Maudiozyma barnettii TaxID=61262 RepID=A0A8H2ZGZ2_9SACH|nr:Rmi1p [Kazachstania barnettii]CAB4255159.1 similar to Saccharomyces cerevisiae YPL024W RMI1 Subunit of the RecQ (Sgs1p) - Topo III (Top3p) complex [Kazachstania barnettii]CAD1783430.1 similar to Saccharomyces cerevisiae YPL024W RMI1 Subunit of the RecQ (Sgs1p) - Topo III (Top3p) complex [Kazachstania barnettii]
MSNFTNILISNLTDSNIQIPKKNDPLRNVNPIYSQLYDTFENEPWLPNSSKDSTQMKMIKTDSDLLFQVLMIENISKSKQSQLDDLSTKFDPKNQRVDTLRQSKGPKKFDIVNQVDLDKDDNATTSNNSNNTTSTIPLKSSSDLQSRKTVYKITLQTKKSDIFFAINTYPIHWDNCCAGAKLIIKKGTIFNRGVFYLKEELTAMCFGSVHSWVEQQDLKKYSYLEGKLSRDNDGFKDVSTSRKRKAIDISEDDI